MINKEERNISAYIQIQVTDLQYKTLEEMIHSSFDAWLASEDGKTFVMATVKKYIEDHTKWGLGFARENSVFNQVKKELEDRIGNTILKALDATKEK